MSSYKPYIYTSEKLPVGIPPGETDRASCEDTCVLPVVEPAVCYFAGTLLHFPTLLLAFRTCPCLSV